MENNNDKGQSTVEYLLLVCAIIYILISFVPKVAKSYTSSIEKQLKDSSSAIGNSITSTNDDGCVHKKKGKHKKHKQH